MDLFDNSMKAKGHYLPMAMMTSIGSHHCGVLLRGIVQLPGFDCELRVAASMTNLYCGHCFPVEITSYCVWLYYTVSLSFYDIEAMMLYRGITVPMKQSGDGV